MYKKSLIGR